MKEFIVSETTKIFNKAIKKFAKEEGKEDNQVSLLLRLVGEGEREIEYRICHDYQPVKSVGIMQILGVKIDLRGYSLIVPPQIKGIIEDFEEKHQSKEIEIGVFLKPEDEDDIVYYLFKEGRLVSGFKLPDVLKIAV